MIETKKTDSSEVLEMSPELSALEASLGSLRPVAPAAVREKMKTAILCECCRIAEQRKVPSRDVLVETIVQAGGNEITISLTQYVRSIQRSATLFGGLIGLIVGCLATSIALFCFVRFASSPSPKPPTVPNSNVPLTVPDWTLENNSSRFIPNGFDPSNDLPLRSFWNNPNARFEFLEERPEQTKSGQY